MLPFLKPKKLAGVIISQRKPDGSSPMEHSEGDELHDLEVASEAILRAITSKDAKALASALKDAFEICDSYPHEEGEHLEEESEE